MHYIMKALVVENFSDNKQIKLFGLHPLIIGHFLYAIRYSRGPHHDI